jgi:tetratricopeptide (TPR) repeat protein
LFERALDMTPAAYIKDRLLLHNRLGIAYSVCRDTDRALYHYRHDVQYSEQAGEILGAGQTRYNIALLLQGDRRFDDARAYAEAALANYQSLGQRAAKEIGDAENLIAEIRRAQLTDGKA